MGRPRKQRPTFADALDVFCETSSEAELRDAAVQIRTWAKQRKLGFVVHIVDLALDYSKHGSNSQPSATTRNILAKEQAALSGEGFAAGWHKKEKAVELPNHEKLITRTGFDKKHEELAALPLLKEQE